MNVSALSWTNWQSLLKAYDVVDGDPFGFYTDAGVLYADEIWAANETDCPQNWASGI